MFLIRVIPIARGIFKDYLTFFSREPMPEGSVVFVPVRGKRLPALTVGVSGAREEKLDIRSAGYELKKIPAGAKPRRIFSKAFIRAAKDAALWHGVHESITLGQLASRAILAAAGCVEETPGEKKPPIEEEEKETRAKSDLLVLQAERGERVRTYRNLAREAFARGRSLVILAPTVIEAEIMADELSRGIEERVVLLTGEMGTKKLIREWNRAVRAPEPILVVGTALALPLPRQNVDAIVIERESARAWRKLERPRLDVRRVAERLSLWSGSRLIYADFPLRVETRYRVDANHAEELARSQARPSGTVDVRIVDARASEEKRKARRIFSTVTEETKQAIRSALAAGGRAAVFAARRGLAPLTVCNDCGTPVSDPVTGTPMVLHKTAKGNIFLSHRSGASVPAQSSCHTCGGWNLVTLGIAVDRVTEELKRHFPETPVFALTTDGAPTHAGAKKIARGFFATPGAVIVGTERMLPYLVEPVEISVVASIDSMLSLPVWRAHEHALSILFYLRERTGEKLIVETREPAHLVMEVLASGNPAEFYRADLAERKRYGYPPFALFIGLSWRGTRAAVEALETLVKESFSDLDLIGPLPAEQVTRSEWHSTAVIRLSPHAWPDRALAERLKALPPSIEVTIDPDEIV